jgi:hypothetical protein
MLPLGPLILAYTRSGFRAETGHSQPEKCYL